MPTTKYKKKSAAKKRQRLIIALITGVLIIILVGLGIHNLRSSQKPAGGPTPAQIKQDSDINAENKKSATSEAGNTGVKGQEPGSPTPTSQPAQSSIEMSAKQEPNATVTIATKLLAVSSGTCTLTITNGAKKVSKTAVVIYQPEFSTCAGFNIPVSELGSGTWNISLDVAYGDTSLSKTISFEAH